jgi:glycosyltransferase involved in cell wall biosynthesis
MSYIDPQQNLPKISIITVVYNGAAYIEKTIRSILDQTYPHIEYIIIDGASTDGTIDIIKKYELKIGRWISEPDTGLYHAMNKGIDLATGEYLWFINAGDQLYDHHIVEKIFLKAEAEYADVYYGDTMIIDINGNEIGMRRQTTPEDLSWRDFKIGMPVSHQSFVPRKSIAGHFNLKYKYSSDIDWVMHCLVTARSVTNSHLILSRFLDGGQSKQTILPSLRERFQIMREYFGLIRTLWYHIPIACRFILFLLRNRRF